MRGPPTEHDANVSDASRARGMTPVEFSDRLNRSSRLFWLVAIGIVRDASLAEDVVQEAALTALTRLDQFTEGTSFNAWMGQVVRYVALNHARRERKHRGVGGDAGEADFSRAGGEAGGSGGQARRAGGTAAGSGGMGGAVGGGSGGGGGQGSLRLTARGELPTDQVVFDDRVVAALNSVSDVARTCLLLRTIEGLEYREIARLVDIPEGTAMSHVHRTRQFLRDRLAGMVRENQSDDDRSGGQP